MTQADWAPPTPPASAEFYTDGEWHRLHPASPLLKGGIAFVAIAGVVLVNLRDSLITAFFGGPDDDGDPIGIITHSGYGWIAALGVVVLLAIFVAFFYISWRMHSFRITKEVVEVRSGVLFRTNRKGRLDRIQGINIVRPFLARIFGAARLEVNVAGQDANVHLAYLSSSSADELRREILRLASGTQQPSLAPAVVGADGIVQQRVAELLAPELDPREAPPESVVTMHLGRVLGSLLLSNTTVVILVIVIALITGAFAAQLPFIIFGAFPAIIGMASFYISKFTRSLRYTIAGTPDGIRIGFGLLSTSNETLPPGRVHAVQVSQPLLWRIPGWWEIKINQAAKSSNKGAAGAANTTILPVGNRDEVMKVLALVLPSFNSDEAKALLASGLRSGGSFTTSPRRAIVLRAFSWRRNGFAIADDAVLLRTGAIWRQLVVVPLARMQSVAISVGPLRRRLRLASIRVHTVAGPVAPAIGALDAADARTFFDDITRAAVTSGTSDTSQRWRSHETNETA